MRPFEEKVILLDEINQNGITWRLAGLAYERFSDESQPRLPSAVAADAYGYDEQDGSY
jgi:hypothetical protein